jgi:hypothetical protein
MNVCCCISALDTAGGTSLPVATLTLDERQLHIFDGKNEVVLNTGRRADHNSTTVALTLDANHEQHLYILKRTGAIVVKLNGADLRLDLPYVLKPGAVVLAGGLTCELTETARQHGAGGEASQESQTQQRGGVLDDADDDTQG